MIKKFNIDDWTLKIGDLVRVSRNNRSFRIKIYYNSQNVLCYDALGWAEVIGKTNGIILKAHPNHTFSVVLLQTKSILLIPNVNIEKIL